MMQKHQKETSLTSKHSKVPKRMLADGHYMPAFGLGTINLKENELGDIIKGSIEHGFFLIDASPVYGNEQAIG